MRMFRWIAFALAATLGGASLPRAEAEVPEAPAGFSDPLDIDNPWHPFVTFRIRLYEQVRGGGNLHVIDAFLPDTRTFVLANGTEVECAVLQEYEVEDGELLEISWNYFAQDDDGTVWYFGEVVDVYEGGEVVGHGGSWLVGGPGSGDPDGVLEAEAPTVFMPASPERRDRWKAEDLPEDGIEEFDRVVRFFREWEVPAGEYERVMKVEERTPDVGYKWYARGVGFLQQQDGKEVVALAEIEDSDDACEFEEELEELLEDLLE